MPDSYLKIDVEEIRAERKKPKEPPVVIALKLNRAAAAIDVSVPYLKKAAAEGKIPCHEKKQPGKGRGLVLFLVKDLEAFVASGD